ncbi:MAG: flagellar brake protein [Pseudomonadales bacterium]
MTAAAKEAEQNTGSRYTTERATIEAAFKHFRDQRTKVKVRFDKIADSFTATILDVVDDNVLLEDIVPRNGLQHLRRGSSFSMAARGDGLYLYVDGIQAHRSDSERGIPYFWIKMPSSVLYQQRRKSKRIDLPMRVKSQGARIRIQIGNRELLGDILDLSAGGVRAQFCGQDEQPLTTNQVLSECVLHIRDQLDLSSQAIVRHAVLDARAGVLSCGLELDKMHVTDRRRLEQYVQSLARRPGAMAGNR